MQKDKPHRLIERWEQERGATEALDQLRHTAVFHKDFHSLWIKLTLGEEQDVHRAAGKGWEAGAVRLMTLHGSKGLEFPAVILVGIKPVSYTHLDVYKRQSPDRQGQAAAP